MKYNLFLLGILFVSFFANICNVNAFLSQGEKQKIEEELLSGEPALQVRAMQRLVESGIEAEEIKNMLVTVLDDPDMRLRMYAMRMLYKMGYREYLEPFFSMLEEENVSSNAKLRIIRGLINLEDEEIAHRLASRAINAKEDQMQLHLIKGLTKTSRYVLFDPQIQELLKDFLREGTAEEKRFILTMFDEEDASIMPLLEIALSDKMEEIKLLAIERLANVNTREANTLLRNFLDSDNQQMVYAASFALGVNESAHFFRHITKDLYSDNSTLQMAALDFLFKKINKKESRFFDSIVDRLAQGEENDENVRERAAEFLALRASFNRIDEKTRQAEQLTPQH